MESRTQCAWPPGRSCYDNDCLSGNSNPFVAIVGKLQRNQVPTEGPSDPHKAKGFYTIEHCLPLALKCDSPTLEFPFFALKAGDKRIRTYERNGIKIHVKPGPDGCATIHDKDIWIYCISQIVKVMNRGLEDVDRTVRFTAADFLGITNRGRSGRAYERMGDALARLAGTRIETSIKTPGYRERGGFGLIESWRAIERDKDDRMVAVEVTLPDWLYRSIKSKHVLTLSPDYFQLRKPLDRRIYELARKHCGRQGQWKIGLDSLHDKSGSASSKKEFIRMISELVEHNDLPDYYCSMDQSSGIFTFSRRG